MSYENFRLYRSLGSLIKSYRQFHDLTQERFSEIIGISVRSLRRWEADQRCARMENLHDLSEIAGIPMQVCVALNADQPIWYSLRKRLFAYSSLEAEQFVLSKLLKHRPQSKDMIFRKSVPIITDKYFNAISLYHRDIYGTKKMLKWEVLKTAGAILPDLNRIFFDSWGHYMGHLVCLPIKTDVYRQLKQQEAFEEYLTTERISDIVSLHEGVYFFYSFTATDLTTARHELTECENYFAGLEQKQKHKVAFFSATKESNEFLKVLGMRVAFTKNNYGAKKAEVPFRIFELEADALLKNIGSSVDMGQVIKQKCEDKKTGDMSIVDDMPIVDKTGQNNTKNIKPQTIETQICSKPACRLYGKRGKGNIISNGTYRTKKGILSRRFLCKECGTSFSSRGGTIFYDLRCPEEKVLKALELLIKGMPLRRAAKIIGVQYNTIGRWLKLAAKESEKTEAMLMKDLNVSKVELNELWTFVRENSLRQRAALYNRGKDN